MFRLNRKAQSTAEYAIVIALVIGAVMAMQVYVRRGLQGRMKGAVDNYFIGQTSSEIPLTPETSVPGRVGLYEPEKTERQMTQFRTSTSTEQASIEGGQIDRTANETTYLGAGAYEKEKAP